MTSPYNYGWENCPPEILSLILKYTNYKTLLNSMQVNKHWNDIAVYTGDKYGQWEQLVKNKMTNGGTTFKQKSNLNWKEVYKNSLLWFEIAIAETNLYQKYYVDCVSNMNVYRDNLIIISPNEVKYFHIETCKLIRSIETTCIDFDETDYIVLEVKHQSNPYKTLKMSGKSNPSKFECDNHGVVVLTDVLHYKLESDICYILDKRHVIWQHRWDHKTWKSNALSRYFGQPNTVQAFTVYKKDVCLLTTNGNVYRTDRNLLKLEKLCHMSLLQPTGLEKLFEIVIASIYKYDSLGEKVPDSILLNEHFSTQRSPVATLNHGDIMILAFDDGLVQIDVYYQKQIFLKTTIKEFNVKQFLSPEECFDIVSLNVYEANKSHHVFVATNKYVFQVHLIHNL